MNVYNERIKRLMREQRKTQRDVADLLGMAQPTVHQKLNGTNTFQIEDLIKISAFFGMTICDFLYDGQPTEEEKAPQVISPDDLLLILNKRHEEVLKGLNDIRQLLKASQKDLN